MILTKAQAKKEIRAAAKSAGLTFKEQGARFYPVTLDLILGENK